METSLGRHSLKGAKRDARWDRWLAKGRAHDADAQYRARLVAILVASIIAVGLAVTLITG